MIGQRGRAKVALGSGGDPPLERAIRVHGNFAEYAPLGIVLLLLVELSGHRPWIVHVLGVVLLAGRLTHVWGVSHGSEVPRIRVAGMVATLVMLCCCLAATCLARA